MAASTLSVLFIVALIAWIFHLKGRWFAFLAMLILFGVLLGNVGGTPGRWADTAARWTLAAPANLVAIFG